MEEKWQIYADAVGYANRSTWRQQHGLSALGPIVRRICKGEDSFFLEGASWTPSILFFDGQWLMFTDRFIQVDWDPLWCWNLRIWSGPLVELHSALLPLTEGKCQFMPRCRYAHHIKSSSHLPCLVRSVCMRTHLDHAGFDTGLIVLRRALMHPVDNRRGYCRYKTYGQASRVITGIR